MWLPLYSQHGYKEFSLTLLRNHDSVAERRVCWKEKNTCRFHIHCAQVRIPCLYVWKVLFCSTFSASEEKIDADEHRHTNRNTLPDTTTFVNCGYVVTLITYTNMLPTRTAIIAPFIISLYKSITHHRAIKSDFYTYRCSKCKQAKVCTNKSSSLSHKTLPLKGLVSSRAFNSGNLWNHYLIESHIHIFIIYA